MNNRQRYALNRLEEDSGGYGCIITLVAIVWGVIIIRFNLPEKIAKLTFSFLAQVPFNVITGIILWLVVIVLVLLWCSKEEDRRLKKIENMGEED